MDPMTRQPQATGDESKSFSERADDARHKTTEAIDSAKQKTAEVTSAAADKASDAMTTAGDQISNLAQTVREKAPAEGRAGEIATNAAEALERGGRYLQQADPTMVRGDLERVIREHPIEAMLVGLGVGYLLARSMRR
jgi:ElaB/YqjD/DUF883 family membrane-anchored ribosome-binding protein